MEHPYPKGTQVELLLDGKPYTEGVVKTVRKTRGKLEREKLGEYDYYITGEGFGDWQYSNNVRIKKPIVLQLIEALEVAHDLHVWDRDDDHPKDGCAYCVLTKKAREEFKFPAQV